MTTKPLKDGRSSNLDALVVAYISAANMAGVPAPSVRELSLAFDVPYQTMCGCLYRLEEVGKLRRLQPGKLKFEAVPDLLDQFGPAYLDGLIEFLVGVPDSEYLRKMFAAKRAELKP